jgi:hypothetical protein
MFHHCIFSFSSCILRSFSGVNKQSFFHPFTAQIVHFFKVLHFSFQRRARNQIFYKSYGSLVMWQIYSLKGKSHEISWYAHYTQKRKSKSSTWKRNFKRKWTCSLCVGASDLSNDTKKHATKSCETIPLI